MDEQVRGPYRLWEHTHSFNEEGDETIIEGIVRYGLPFWPFGEIAHPIVRLQAPQDGRGPSTSQDILAT